MLYSYTLIATVGVKGLRGEGREGKEREGRAGNVEFTTYVGVI